MTDYKKDYVERQDEWIKKNSIVFGKTQARVTRRANGQEEGWHNCWVEEMSQQVNEIVTITIEAGSTGIRCRHLNGYSNNYPYFVLEPIFTMRRNCYV